MSVTNSQNKWLHSATPLLPATVHRISFAVREQNSAKIKPASLSTALI